MATPKKSTATKKTTRTAKKRKAKKPKVILSAKKVYLLSGVIVLLCAVSLALSVAVSSRKNAAPDQVQTEQPASTEHAKADATVSAPTQSPAQKPVQPVAPNQQPATAKTQQQKAVVAQAAKTENKTQTTAAATPKAEKPAQSKASKAGANTAQTNAAQTQKPAAANVNANETARTKPAASPTTPTAPVTQPNPVGAIASAKADRPATAQSAKPATPTQPASPFAVPPAKDGATLVFVIDDAGLHADNVKKYTALPFPLAIAVLPRLAQSKACAAEIRRAGKELMLHQPMQAHAYASGTVPDPGPGAILPDMTTAQIAETVKVNLDEIGPGVKGFNNHEGSLITENEIKMGAVLEVAAERGVYFLDSRTTSQTAVPQAALERDLPYIARYAPFLDNTIDRAAMLAELYKGLEVANKNGYAVIIGHVDKSVKILPQLLADIYPYLVQAGYRFATPSQLR